MGKCAWCGNYIPDSADKQGFNNAMGMMGLDLITKPLGKALIKQYCSKACKVAAEQAKNGGGGNSGGGNSGSGSPAAVSATAAETDNAEKKEGLQTIMAISFEGDASSIVLRLGDLQTLFSAHKSGNKDSAKAIRNAIIEKMGLGIRLLSSKGDTTNAAYFEGVLKKFKIKAFLASAGF
ncbi:hypothetical protein AGMMS4952_27220 [Spirochaetia bacterium]|nr:hypothetical protein AGMMS4952_27220 [Spirochaetia bacterium]